MSEETSQQILLTQILEKLDKIEKTFVSMNADLINQNIKMSELLNGKLKEPDFEMPDSSNQQNSDNSNKEKELYYYENNEKIIVYGPGTFDNRPTLKQYGDWNSFNKSWDLAVDLNILLEKLPKIIKKEKSSLFIGNDQVTIKQLRDALRQHSLDEQKLAEKEGKNWYKTLVYLEYNRDENTLTWDITKNPSDIVKDFPKPKK